MREGQSGLLHATTGSGKTLAVAFGAWLAGAETPDAEHGPHVLWITPMRALAADTERSLREAFAGALPPPTLQDRRRGGSAPAPATHRQASARR
jgi:Lhr-like helicase